MAQTEQPAPRAKWGPLELASGVSQLNAWAFMFASFFAIGLIAFFNVGQSYILREMVGLDRGEFGQVTGLLQVTSEVIAIILIPIFGVLSDRIGRRVIMIFAFVLLGVGYGLYAFATSVPELLIYRGIATIGISAMAGMMATIANDYPSDKSRGMFIGIHSVFNSLGVIFLVGNLGGLPQRFTDSGMDAVTAGRTSWLIITAICLIVAVVLQFGLKGGAPGKKEDRLPYGVLITSGIRAAKNPRVALAYGNSFAARADLTIVGVFITLWGQKAAIALGIPTGQAMAMAIVPFLAAQISALLFSPIIGLIIDRVNRVSVMIFASGLSAMGYLSMYFVESPLQEGVWPIFVFLGLGYVSSLVACTALIGQETPKDNERGAIMGFFGLAGAVGILFSSAVGGFLFDYYSPAPFILMGTINIGLFFWGIRVRRHAPDPEIQRFNQNVVITGSTRGIGYGLAKEFLVLGNNVVVCGRSQEAVDKALLSLGPTANQSGAKLIGAACDVSNKTQVQALWDKALNELGDVNIWINNAGIANTMQPLVALPVEEIDKVVKTNLIGTMNCCQVALTGMQKQGFGEIYNFEGFGSDGNTTYGLSVYGSTKRAIRYFTDSLIRETKGTPVKVGSLSPGIVVTDMLVGEGQVPPENWHRVKNVYGILGDRVETVTPWLVRHTLLNDQHGARISWLSRSKSASRFLTARWTKRNIFAEMDSQQ